MGAARAGGSGRALGAPSPPAPAPAQQRCLHPGPPPCARRAALQVLFRVALALLKLHEPLLLAQDNPGELLRAARRVAAEAYDRDTLMKVCVCVCVCEQGTRGASGTGGRDVYAHLRPHS